MANKYMIKHKLWLQYSSFIALSLFTPQLFAGVFDVPLHDKSLNFLGIIFGSPVGNIPLGDAPPNIVISQMFEKLNLIAVTVGIIVVSYTALISTIQTAQEGQIMGKKWSSIWIPMRSFIGMLLMVPTPGTGYSIIQVTVLWLILQGIGAANQIWYIVLDNLERGVSATAATNLSGAQLNAIDQDAKILTENLFYSAVCMAAMQKINSGTALDDSIQTIVPFAGTLITEHGSDIKAYYLDPTESLQESSYTYKGYFNIGTKASSIQAASQIQTKVCGSYEVISSVQAEELQGTSDAAQQQAAKSLSKNAYNTKILALNTMFTELYRLAQAVVNDQVQPKDSSGRIAQDSGGARISHPNVLNGSNSIFKNFMGQLITSKAGGTQTGDNVQQFIESAQVGSRQQAIESVRNAGWISAGSFYFIMNKVGTVSLLETAKIVPKLKADKTIAEVIGNENDISKVQTNLKEKVFNGVNIADRQLKFIAKHFINARNYTKLSPMTSGSLSANSLDFKGGGGSGGSLAALNKSAANDMRNYLSDPEGDPLVGITSLGSKLMLNAEITFIIFTAGTALIVAAAGSPGTLGVPLQLAIAAQTFFLTFGSVLLSVLIALWLAGATMSIYVPMIPYMIFTLTAIGWFILVIEAIVAAPILALAMVIPSGDELGKLSTGIGLLTGIFFRPTLMIFGFVLSAKLFQAAVSLVNFGMVDAIGSISKSGSLLSAIPVMFLFAGFMVALVNKCFSLIYVLPDRVLRWIGITPEQTDLSAMQEAKGTVEAGAKGTAEAMRGVGEAPGAVAKAKAAGKEGSGKASDAPTGTSNAPTTGT